MASSSGHNTAVERQIKVLLVLVYARLLYMSIPRSTLHSIIDAFLNTLELDVAWLHTSFEREPVPITTHEQLEEIADLRKLADRLRAESRNMSNSALFHDVANACYETAKLLRATGRQSEADEWSNVSKSWQITAEVAYGVELRQRADPICE